MSRRRGGMVSMRIIMIGKGEQKADRCTEVLLRIAGYKYDYQNCIVNCYFNFMKM